ncbi:MAG: D-alanyl-D-alanine carboxypeptidase/D-alanyl-D-alanine-endopeptidase [Undibacterium sp.]|nr:D-alanyl-D-alanine carboxypeptidase/D-alanyl-D-alanine-endopeptidase [Undibacterium sp.]
MTKKILAVASLFCTLTMSVSTPAWSQQSLPASVEASLSQQSIPTTALSAVIMRVGDQPASLALSPTQAMSPASTMKLLTSFIALDELGPSYRWKTKILAATEPSRGKLKDDLYLRGGAAPDLSWDKLALMLRQLRAKGLRKIEGNITLDRSYFQPTRLDIQAPPFDEFPDAYYNVIPDALLVSSNLISFEIDAKAEQIIVNTSPPMSHLQINNQLKIQEKNCNTWEDGWNPPQIDSRRVHKTSLTTITLSGNYPRNCKITTELNILDRNLYLEHLIRQLWTEMGGSWQGAVKEGETPANAQVLVERSSETLADILKVMNKRSDNAVARLLYLTLGAEFSEKQNYPTTLEASQARVLKWFAKNSVDSTGLVLENGSGLSRLERISAQTLAGLLQVASRSNWFPEYLASLPIVALDGTMRKRLKGSAAEGRARIKTGTLNGSTAVAGYVQDKNNQWWIIVAMVNHPLAGKARPALDELINWVANGQ